MSVYHLIAAIFINLPLISRIENDLAVNSFSCIILSRCSAADCLPNQMDHLNRSIDGQTPASERLPFDLSNNDFIDQYSDIDH